MRAVAIRRFRDPPELMDLPTPSPGPGEIRVRLAAAGVNPLDWKVLDGLYDPQWKHQFPLIAGVDGAGTVDAVGPGVRRFVEGDELFGQFLHEPVGRGTYAEYLVAPERLGLARVPKGLSLAEAAAVPTAGMTAVQTLEELGLAPGDTLVIQGAAGGVGSYATQLAAHAGVTVLATSRGPYRPYLLELGAREFYDAGSATLAADIRAAHPAGVDALLDLYDRGPAFDAMTAVLRPGGQATSTVGAVDAKALEPRGLRGRNIDLHPRSEQLERLAAEFLSGRLRIPLEQRRALEEGPRVLAESRAGTLKGKAILTI